MIQPRSSKWYQKTIGLYLLNRYPRGIRWGFHTFGVFEAVKIRKAWSGAIPTARKSDVPIPARAMVKFKAGKEMRAEVLKLPSVA